MIERIEAIQSRLLKVPSALKQVIADRKQAMADCPQSLAGGPDRQRYVGKKPRSSSSYSRKRTQHSDRASAVASFPCEPFH